jgi:hypothetical protein
MRAAKTCEGAATLIMPLIFTDFEEWGNRDDRGVGSIPLKFLPLCGGKGYFLSRYEDKYAIRNTGIFRTL